MSKTAALLKTRDLEYLAQIEANLAEVKRSLRKLEVDRQRQPLISERKVSILDEVKAILGKR